MANGARDPRDLLPTRHDNAAPMLTRADLRFVLASYVSEPALRRAEIAGVLAPLPQREGVLLPGRGQPRQTYSLAEAGVAAVAAAIRSSTGYGFEQSCVLARLIEDYPAGLLAGRGPWGKNDPALAVFSFLHSIGSDEDTEEPGDDAAVAAEVVAPRLAGLRLASLGGLAVPLSWYVPRALGLLVLAADDNTEALARITHHA